MNHWREGTRSSLLSKRKVVAIRGYVYQLARVNRSQVITKVHYLFDHTSYMLTGLPVFYTGSLLLTTPRAITSFMSLLSGHEKKIQDRKNFLTVPHNCTFISTFFFNNFTQGIFHLFFVQFCRPTFPFLFLDLTLTHPEFNFEHICYFQQRSKRQHIHLL